MLPDDDGDTSEVSSEASSSSSWFSLLHHTVKDALSDRETDQNETPGLGSVTSSGYTEEPAGVPGVVQLGQDHSSADCNPCVLFATHRGCSRGRDCRYCHAEHTDKPKVSKRPRKQTRDKYKQVVINFLEANEDNLYPVQDEMQELADKSPYLRNLLQGLLDSPEEAEQLFGAKALPVPTTNAEGATLRTPGPQPAASEQVASSVSSSPLARPPGPEGAAVWPDFALQ